MERAEAIEWVKKICAYLTAGNPIWRNEPIIDACDTAVRALEQPEIILCKDCIDYQTDWIPESIPDRHYCATMDSMMPEDAYCSYAERRRG